MDIKYNAGTYEMRINENETSYYAVGSNIYRAKEFFMKRMSQMFDEAVDRQLGFITEIERLNNK
jgi:hypothetical protein